MSTRATISFSAVVLVLGACSGEPPPPLAPGGYRLRVDRGDDDTDFWLIAPGGQAFASRWIDRPESACYGTLDQAALTEITDALNTAAAEGRLSGSGCGGVDGTTIGVEIHGTTGEAAGWSTVFRTCYTDGDVRPLFDLVTARVDAMATTCELCPNTAPTCDQPVPGLVCAGQWQVCVQSQAAPVYCDGGAVLVCDPVAGWVPGS